MDNTNYCERAKLIEKARKYPYYFAELCGVKLTASQKIALKVLSKMQPSPRRSMKKYHTYLQLCRSYIHMNVDDHMIIASPKEWKKLTKKELEKYIEDYWKEVKI